MRHYSKILVLATLAVALSAAAQTPAPSNPPAGTPAPIAKLPPGARLTRFDPSLLQPGPLRVKSPEVYEVRVVTSAGDFGVKITRAWAPNGADRFYNLVLHHFYDGAAFFRVLPGFMAQFGLSAFPEVSRAWDKANIKDDPVVQSNHRGFITYAMAGPNTRTTQVFINYGNNERLDKDGFAPFGVVTNGMEVVDKLYSGYGEGAPAGRGPDQGLIGNQGKDYLEKMFPKLDTIKSASLAPTQPAGR
jgi:peptidyl-prolyl cis-trans isomerase A (cyclophilin A)